MPGSQSTWMWSQCKTLMHSWQRSSSWWDFLSRKYQWRKITLDVENFDLHSWQICAPIVWSQCTGVCANHLWETLSQTYLLPRPHGEVYPWNICISTKFCLFFINMVFLLQFFDPFHIDGCVYDVPLIDPNVDPLITRVGTPSPF